MKREFLRKLGLEDEVIDKIMAQSGQENDDYRDQIAKQTEAAKAKDARILELEKAYEPFKDVNIEELKAAPEKIKSEYEGKLKTVKVESLIKDKLKDTKYPDLLLGKFDVTKVDFDESGKPKGIDEQYEAIKKQYSDMFEASSPPGTGRGHLNPPPAGQSLDDQIKSALFGGKKT